jgi:inner membrane protein
VNLQTHVIAGAALVTTMLAQEKRPTTPEVVAIGCGVLASLAPDVDEVVNRLVAPFGHTPEGAALAYMLYHRGVTHTLVGCLGLTALIAGLFLAVIAVISRIRRIPPGWLRPPASRLLLIAGVGTLVHLAMDATNDYGVHPFWPFWNRWMYGDFIFLAEPLVLGALLPLAVRPLLRDWGADRANRLPRIVAILVVAGLVGFCWWFVHKKTLITWLGASIATVWMVGLVAWEYRRPSRWRSWAALGVVWLVFLSGSLIAKGRASRWLREHEPQERIISLVTTPAAGDPFCWRVISAGVTPGGEVRTRLGVISLSSISPASSDEPGTAGEAQWSSCFPDLVPKTLALTEWTKKPDPWAAIFRAPLATFPDRESCRIKSTRHFLRAPVWQLSKACDGRLLVGDLRFDYEERLDRYCKYCRAADEPCDVSGPPWEEPFFREAEKKR